MPIKIDDIDLSVPSPSGASRTSDIRTVSRLQISDKRHLVEHHIAGAAGNPLQDMGPESAHISLEGTISGEKAYDVVQKLYDKYEHGKVVQFHSDLSALADVNKALIKNMDAQLATGSVSRYEYKIELEEYRG